jgi:hypothetical protein
MSFRSLFLPILLLVTSIFHASARAQEVDVNFFYTSLQDKGDWFSTDKYGYVFQPRRATQDRGWRPYADGHWGYTDQGWTWISNEDHGWATYHYGRWAQLANTGWVWIPGDQWAPAWVSWRTNPRYARHGQGTAVTTVVTDADSDYIGWAPLPPEAAFQVSVGFTGRVDDEYDIGPASYCFVPTRSFGAPVLTTVIVEPSRNVLFIGRTVNVTNTSRFERGGTAIVFDGGPEITVVETVVERPIQRLTIERQPASVYGRGDGRLANQVRGNSFQVIAPPIAATAIFKPGAPPPSRAGAGPRPANVKGDLKQVQRNPGWDQPGAQPQAVQAAREQIKREAAQAPKQAEAPTGASASGAPSPATSPAPTGATAPNATTPPSAQPTRAPGTATAPPAAAPNATTPPSAQPTRAPGAATAPPSAAPNATPPSHAPATTAVPHATPPTNAPATTAAPTTVPRRESEATPPGRSPATTAVPSRDTPHVTPVAPTSPPKETARPAPTAAPSAAPRATPPREPAAAAEQQKREATRPPPQQPAPEEKRKSQPPKPEATRPDQAERAKPNPTPAEKQRQPAGDAARQGQAPREGAGPSAEAPRRPADAPPKKEAPKKGEPTPAPTS